MVPLFYPPTKLVAPPLLQQERLGPPAARGRGGTPNWVALGGTGGLSPRRGPQEQKAADRSWRTGAGKAAAAAADRRLLQARQPDCKRMSSSCELGGCEPTAFQRLSRPADLLRALNKAHRLQTRAAAPCRLTQGLQTLGQPPGSAPRPPIHPPSQVETPAGFQNSELTPKTIRVKHSVTKISANRDG